MTSGSREDRDFENEVRRIARAKWPMAQFGGAEVLDGRERDGVFETEESIHFIEATVSASAQKAREDTKKLFKAISDHNRSGSLTVGQGWFVTKKEPTADQRKEVTEHGKGQVRAVSFSQFQQSLVDVRAYLLARHDHKFGSVQDFSSANRNPAVPYIDIGLTSPTTGDSVLIETVLDQLLNGKQFAIVGQYGAGKSMTLRELFIRLEEKYKRNQTSKFPVYINLREHSGQRDPIELLERHARSIGFSSPNSLIRAWRAGFVILLIDGFDEMASFGVQGSWKKLRDLRMRSLEGVRRLARDSHETGIVVCGRSHYFEDSRELCTALGLTDASVLSIDAFTEAQVKTFLSKFSSIKDNEAFPDWLPTRPLLLGYLASRNLLTELGKNQTQLDVVDGWDFLLDRIYSREALIETNLDGATLRLILERLATVARSSEDGLGPITRTEMFSAFSEVCGYEPDEQGVLAIQRLPGLGIYRADDESRCFVDRELAAICAGRELFRFFESPYEMEKSSIWREIMEACYTPVADIGAEYVTRNLHSNSDARGVVRQAVAFVNSRSALGCVHADIASVAIRGNFPIDISMTVSEMNFGASQFELHQDLVDVSKIFFSHCLFGQMLIDADIDTERMPSFENCLIEQISGRVSFADLPESKFTKCECTSFDGVATGGAIRAGQFSKGEKALLITLRKLFVQSLSGRSEGALFRGLDVDERRCIPDVLRLLKKHRLVTEYSRGDGTVWIPIRRELDRVRRILAAPNECGEAVVKEARAIG